MTTPVLSLDRPLIVTPKDLRERMAYWREQGAHIIAPGHETSFIAASHCVSEAVMYVDVDPSAGQVYQDPTVMRPHDYAFSRLSLQLISLNAGIGWLPTSGPLSDASEKLFWRYRADAEVKGYDGRMLPIDGTAEVDLRDGSPQMGGWSPAKWRYLIGKNEAAIRHQRARREDLVWHINGWDEALVKRMRQHGLPLAETKAKNRAVRGLGVKPSYTLAEFERPFVIFRVAYNPDMSVEAIRMSVHEHAMGARSALYPQRAAVRQ